MSRIADLMAHEEIITILGPPLRNLDQQGFIGEWRVAGDEEEFYYYIAAETRIPTEDDLIAAFDHFADITESMTDTQLLTTLGLSSFIPYLTFTMSAAVTHNGRRVEECYFRHQSRCRLNIVRWDGYLISVGLEDTETAIRMYKRFDQADESSPHLINDITAIGLSTDAPALPTVDAGVER